jgi:hypothetical protein
MKHVKITTKPGASAFAQRGERIIEFSHPNGGGLISFFPTDNGRLDVSLYRLDSTVDVRFSYDNDGRPDAQPAPVDPNGQTWQVEMRGEGGGWTVVADQFASENDAQEFLDALTRHRTDGSIGMRVVVSDVEEAHNDNDDCAKYEQGYMMRTPDGSHAVESLHVSDVFWDPAHDETDEEAREIDSIAEMPDYTVHVVSHPLNDPTTLSWNYGDAEDTDHYADSAITADHFGIVSAFWHLGPIGDQTWIATLRAQGSGGVEIPDAGKSLGPFSGLAEAKEAAERYEQDNT